MRSIRFTAAAALALALSFVLAPSAFAQEADHGDEIVEDSVLMDDHAEADDGHGEAGDPHAVFEEAEHILHANDAHHADIECVELILVENQTVQDCRDAPNPLLPETNEIIWGAIGFTVVFGFLAKFGLPAAKKAMDERAAKIQADLDAAAQAKADAEAVKAEFAAKVADAKSEAAGIIEEARQAADQLKTDQAARLNDELAAARAAAQVDIDAAKGQAMAELRSEVADIAIGAAESVVGANLDRNAQIQLIEDYINRVSNGAGLTMTTERDKAYATAIAAVGRAEDNLAKVQDEVFALAGVIGASDELVATLSDAAIPVARRQQVIEDLLQGNVAPATLASMSMVVAAGRIRDLQGIADGLVALGAADHGKQVAVVRSAIDLTDDQKTRLATALERQVGHPVDIRVVIDESVLGGIVAQVGDTVIDGTVRRRLDLLKQAI